MTKLHLIRTAARGEALRGEWRRAVRAFAARALGAEADALRIETGAYGKPFLAGCPGFHFSVAHTAGLLVIAQSPFLVGVDAEKLRPVREALADRFFAPYERDYVHSGPSGRDERLLTVWTRKEAWLKYTGTGIRVPLASFDVMDGSLPARLDSFVWEGYVISCCALPAKGGERAIKQT